ncbi:uncharacterized protein LOC142330541 [Lycorma delicatula]|uniref:uncharacterized protein LOC142330541 n=1 Tax=Lycorma delicatula TaxID=130591 RepID=UPI003F50EB09
MFISPILFKTFKCYNIIIIIITFLFFIPGDALFRHGGHNGHIQANGNNRPLNRNQYNNSTIPQNGSIPKDLQDNPKELFKMFSKSMFNIFRDWFHKTAKSGKKVSSRYIKMFFKWIKRRIKPCNGSTNSYTVKNK